MSKPIDQEREAFEAFVRSDAWMFKPDLSRNPATEDYWDIEEQTGWISWQARAAVQPAGVAVPICEMCHGTRRVKEPGCDEGDCTRCLTAASHPVSGEQKPERNETNDQIASVLLQQGTPSQQVEALAYAGITAPPAAQGVSGLVEAMRNVEQTSSSTRLRRIAREALAAQAQGGDA